MLPGYTKPNWNLDDKYWVCFSATDKNRWADWVKGEWIEIQGSGS